MADDQTTTRRARSPLVAIGAAGAGVAALLGVAWLVRLPVAEALIAGRLAEAGVDGAVDVQALDFRGARLGAVRLGAATSPDLRADKVDLGLRWTVLGPQVASVRAQNLAVTARLDETGFSLGSIDALMGPPSGKAPKLPALSLDVAAARITVETPVGRFLGVAEASGRLDEVFHIKVKFPSSDASGPKGRAVGAVGELLAEGRDGRVAARLTAGAASFGWGDSITATALSLSGDAEATTELTTLTSKIRAEAASLEFADTRIEAPGATLEGAAAAFSAQGLEGWSTAVKAEARSVRGPNTALKTLALSGSLAPVKDAADGVWTGSALEAAVGGFVAPRIDLSGAARMRPTKDDATIFELDGLLSAPTIAAAPAARRRVVNTLPALEGTPLAGMSGAARGALQRGLTEFSASAPFLATWRGGAGAAWLTGPVEVKSRSGLAMRIQAPNGGPQAAIGRITLPEGAISAEADATLSGDGFPATLLSVTAKPGQRGGVSANGRIQIAAWKDRASSAALEGLTFALEAAPGSGRLTLGGAMRLSGPLAGFEVRDMSAPLDIGVAWNERGIEVTPSRPLCLSAKIAQLEGLGLVFPQADASLCPQDGAYYRANAAGALSGGVEIFGLSLKGRAVESKAPTGLAAERFEARFVGTVRAPRLALAAKDVALRQQVAADRAIDVTVAGVVGDLRFGDTGWSAAGAVEGAAVSDPSLPTTVAAVAAKWTAAPEGAGVALAFSDGRAVVQDKSLPARFQPLAVRDVTGSLLDGEVNAAGRVALDGGADRTLGVFTASHDIAAGAGQATVTTRDLRFSSELELVEVTELARGVVESVRGPIDSDIETRWTPTGVTATGMLTLRGVSAATAGLGPIDDVSGEVRFDDLFALTTPPGQKLTIAKINPGVAVSNGSVQFQLKPNLTVQLEDARFPFASGTLSVAPTEITIGAAETKYLLRLDGVNLATFLQDMNMKDLRATGILSGSLPLVITPLGGRIEGGRLEAAPGGGVIQYSGQAAGAATGSAGGGQLAFDALKGFRYDNLILDVNGDLDGEIASAIKFQGVNIEPVRPVPGLPTIGRTGLPFRFNVAVTAPFRALLDQANRTADPLALIQQSQSGEAGSDAVQSPPAQDTPRN